MDAPETMQARFFDATAGMPLPTTFIVNAEYSLRGSLESLLGSEEAEVAFYSPAGAFLDQYDPRRPGCLLVNLQRDRADGLFLLEELCSRCIRVPAVVLTKHGDVAAAVRALKHGALEVVEAPFAPQVLLGPLRRAMTVDVISRQREEDCGLLAVRVAQLTAREQQVLKLLAEGCALKQVATTLRRSYKTVDSHKANLMKKLGVHDRVDLALLAIRAGLVEA
jgi:FixJ family two-component response regulator